MALIQAGRLDEAQSHLEQLADDEPSNPRIYVGIAEIAARQRRTNIAIADYQRGVRILAAGGRSVAASGTLAAGKSADSEWAENRSNWRVDVALQQRTERAARSGANRIPSLAAGRDI